jgi:hypothetical protein
MNSSSSKTTSSKAREVYQSNKIPLVFQRRGVVLSRYTCSVSEAKGLLVAGNDKATDGFRWAVDQVSFVTELDPFIGLTTQQLAEELHRLVTK